MAQEDDREPIKRNGMHGRHTAGRKDEKIEENASREKDRIRNFGQGGGRQRRDRIYRGREKFRLRGL